jgi:hypothetical protein
LSSPHAPHPSYLVPLVLRMTVYRSKFKPGPFHLGAFSTVINLVAIAWVSFAITLFILPQVWGWGAEGSLGGP